ncbi:MAG: periplasmic heavy metal sensor [Desulfobacterales bacterium]|nr:periplasmic heavy metal sensor [Desulfobacterales bacterium]
MKKSLTYKIIIALAVFALIGIGVNVYAGGQGCPWKKAASQTQGEGYGGQGKTGASGCPAMAKGAGCKGQVQGSGCPRQGKMAGCKGQGAGCKGKSACLKGLGEEDVKKLDALRQAFFKDTRDLRQEINAKGLELASELAKKDPDAEKAANLQRELSELEARFDQKRLSHVLEAKKINPNAGGKYACRGKRGGGGGCPFQ